MARSCKCAITGEIGTTDVFIKIGSKYYKNQEIYDADQRKKQTYKELLDYICREFLGYGNGQPFPPILPKKIKELSFYSNEVILETFQACASDIHYWLAHTKFSSEYGKISYMFSIIKSHIADVYAASPQRSQKKIKKITEEKTGNAAAFAPVNPVNPVNYLDFDNPNLSGKSTQKSKTIINFLERDEL